MGVNPDVLDQIDRKSITRLRRIIVQSVYETCVARGQLDPMGKAPAALAAEFVRMMEAWIKDPKREFKLIVDYGESLLVEARRFGEVSKHEMALLFYATWFEHWIN